MISRRFWHRRRSRTEVRDELGLGRRTRTDGRTAGGWGTAAVVKRSGNSAAEGESDEGTLAGTGERRSKREER